MVRIILVWHSSGDEEPDYYETYGRDIFLYGVNEHKRLDKAITDVEYEAEKKKLAVPQEYLDDFIARRKVNLAALLHTLKFVGSDIDEFTILQDDSNPYGFTGKR